MEVYFNYFMLSLKKAFMIFIYILLVRVINEVLRRCKMFREMQFFWFY